MYQARWWIHGRIGAWSPLTKIAVWLGAVVALGGILQAGATLLGLPLNVLDHGILLGIGLATLLTLMAADRLSPAEYGLAVGDNWLRQACGGLLLGIAIYGSYCLAACLWGVYQFQTDSITTSRLLKAGFAALAAIPLAATQQIIFAGYMLSILRERYGRVLAVLGSATLFATFSILGPPSTMLAYRSVSLAIGMFLIAVLLGTLRIRFGTIVFAAALLAGCSMVRRVTGTLRLLEFTPQSLWSPYVAPFSDPRRGPLLWLILVVGIGIVWYLIMRFGERKVDPSKTLSPSFKRIIPFSNLLALAPLDIWLGRLADARFRVSWKYWPRLVYVLFASTVNTLLSLPERLAAPWLLRHRVPDPVFIVGMHRSGTTHLHNLLSLDVRYCTPRNFQVWNPFGFLSTGWLYAPLMAAFMTLRRPIDAMQMNLLSPQEDEFALAGMSKRSPYWSGTFPRRIDNYDRYIFVDQLPPGSRRHWQQSLLLFLRKLTLWNRRTPLLKSPYHTARVGALRELFPRAKFIHICRHPHDTYRSNVKLARDGWIVFQLHDPCPVDNFETRFLDKYKRIEQAFYRDAVQLPETDLCEVRFEDLERDPVGQVRRIYHQLGLPYELDYHRRLEEYLASIKGYQKNRLDDLDEQQRRQINAIMAPYLLRWSYVAPHQEKAS